MTYFLREVFGAAASYANSAYQKISDTYDYVGYTFWRALNDDTWLAISPAAVDSPLLKKAVMAYDGLKGFAQASLSDNLQKTVRNGDYGPKPDIKPGLFKILGQTAALAGRANWGHPVMMTAAIGAIAIAAYTLTQAGAGHGMQDSIAALYSSSGSNMKPGPTTPNLTP
jgi:hypothetical protein